MKKVTLTSDEKKTLWSKLEYSKKRKAKESSNDLFNVLSSESDSTVSVEEFKNILNSLEYRFKKSLKERNNRVYQNLIDKLPKEWI